MTDNLKTDALDEPHVFTYLGTEYTVPPADDWDLDAIEAQEDGKMLTFLKVVLGPEQWKTFKATKPKTKDLTAFLEAMDGVTTGEEQG